VPIERISFVDALRWLATAQVGDPLPALVVNPRRPGASNLAPSNAAPSHINS
jgi:hypothetical protein